MSYLLRLIPLVHLFSLIAAAWSIFPRGPDGLSPVAERDESTSSVTDVARSGARLGIPGLSIPSVLPLGGLIPPATVSNPAPIVVSQATVAPIVATNPAPAQSIVSIGAPSQQVNQPASASNNPLGGLGGLGGLLTVLIPPAATSTPLSVAPGAVPGQQSAAGNGNGGGLGLLSILNGVSSIVPLPLPAVPTVAPGPGSTIGQASDAGIGGLGGLLTVLGGLPGILPVPLTPLLPIPLSVPAVDSIVPLGELTPLISAVLTAVPELTISVPGLEIPPLALPTGLIPGITSLAIPAGDPLGGLGQVLTGILGDGQSGVINQLTSEIFASLASLVPLSDINGLLSQAALSVGLVTSLLLQPGPTSPVLTVPLPTATQGASASTSIPQATVNTPSIAIPGGLPAASSPTLGALPSASISLTPSVVTILPITTGFTRPSQMTQITVAPGTSPAGISVPTNPVPGGLPPISSPALSPPSGSGIPANGPGSASTVYVVTTVTELYTATAIVLSTVTTCPGGTMPIPLSSNIPCTCPAGSGSSQPTGKGPCPGEGYTCDDCLDGWFCPPKQTPALPAPCGYGWPCYHCSQGWFCVPQSPAPVTMCPLAPPTNPIPNPHTVAPVQTTITATTVVTVPASPSGIDHPAIAGWAYGGCFKDDNARAMKARSITTPVMGGMTNEKCIKYCQTEGFNLAGTENGYQCFCDNQVVDSWMVDDSSCNMNCTGDSSTSCGGPWTLSMWSPNGQVPQVAGPEMQFHLQEPPPGASEISVHTGGLRKLVVEVTTPVFAFPPPLSTTPTSSTRCTTGSTSQALIRDIKILAANQDIGSDTVPTVDIADIASTVRAIVAAAMSEAHQIAASELAKASQVVVGAQSLVGNGFESLAQGLHMVAAQAYTIPSPVTETITVAGSVTPSGLVSSSIATPSFPVTVASPTQITPPNGVGSASPVGQLPTTANTGSPSLSVSVLSASSPLNSGSVSNPPASSPLNSGTLPTPPVSVPSNSGPVSSPINTGSAAPVGQLPTLSNPASPTTPPSSPTTAPVSGLSLLSVPETSKSPSSLSLPSSVPTGTGAAPVGQTPLTPVTSVVGSNVPSVSPSISVPGSVSLASPTSGTTSNPAPGTLPSIPSVPTIAPSQTGTAAPVGQVPSLSSPVSLTSPVSMPTPTAASTPTGSLSVPSLSGQTTGPTGIPPIPAASISGTGAAPLTPPTTGPGPVIPTGTVNPGASSLPVLSTPPVPNALSTGTKPSSSLPTIPSAQTLPSSPGVTGSGVLPVPNTTSSLALPSLSSFATSSTSSLPAPGTLVPNSLSITNYATERFVVSSIPPAIGLGGARFHGVGRLFIA